MGLIIDGVRWILWLICKGCFFVVDSVYNIILPIISFDISTNSTMWSWWYILCAFLLFFTLIRVTSIFLKASLDEDYSLKLEPMGIIVRIAVIAFVIATMPIAIKYFTSLSSLFIRNASELFVVTNNIVEQKPTIEDEELNEQIEKVYEQYKGMPSMLFISSSSNGEYPPYMLISINEKKGGLSGLVNITGGIPIIGGLVNISTALLGLDGDYIYYPDTTMLIFLIIEAVCTCYMFFLMAIQISQRIYSIGVKILISPIPISSIVKQDDHTFGLWVKLLAADLISNALQYLILLFVMMISSSQAVQQFGIVGQGIFFIGGLLCVLIGPGQIAQLIGGDGMGLFQTMQGFQTMSALKGMTQAAGRTVAGAAGLGASLGVYGAGRALGMNSLGNFPGSGANGGGANPFAGGPSRGSGGGGANPFASGGNKSGARSKIPPKAFSEPSTSKQQSAAKKMGFDASHMSKGQASLELEKRGMDKSFWSDYAASRKSEQSNQSNSNGADDAGFSGFTGGAATGTIDRSNGTYGLDNAGAYTSGSSTGNQGIDDLGTYDDGNDYLGVDGSYDQSAYSAGTGNYENDTSAYYENASGYMDDTIPSTDHVPNISAANVSGSQQEDHTVSNPSSNSSVHGSNVYSNSNDGTAAVVNQVSDGSTIISNDSAGPNTSLHGSGTENHTTSGNTIHETSANKSTNVQQEQNVEPRLSREGSIARRVGDAPGRKAKLAYMVGRSAYASAGNRLMGQKSIYRGGRYITKNTRAQMLSNLHTNVNEIIKPSTISTHQEKRDHNDISELNKFNDRKEEL